MKNKKFVITLLVFIFMILSVCKVYAANSFSANLVLDSTRVTKGSEFKVTLKLVRVSVEGGLSELTGVLEYDDNVLSISKDDVKELNDWSVNFDENTGKISLEKQDPIEDDEEAVTFTFKVAENVSTSNTMIKLRDIEGGNSSLEKKVQISSAIQTVNISSGTGSSPSATVTSSSTPSTTNTPSSTPSSTQPSSTPSATPTSTTNNGTMPDTGAEQSYVLPLLAAIAVLGIIAFLNYKKLDNK